MITLIKNGIERRRFDGHTDSGAATAEYALIIAGAAVMAIIVIYLLSGAFVRAGADAAHCIESGGSIVSGVGGLEECEKGAAVEGNVGEDLERSGGDRFSSSSD